MTGHDYCPNQKAGLTIINRNQPLGTYKDRNRILGRSALDRLGQIVYFATSLEFVDFQATANPSGWRIVQVTS